MIFLQPFQQVLEWLQVTGTGWARAASRGCPPFAFLPRGAQRSWGAGLSRASGALSASSSAAVR